MHKQNTTKNSWKRLVKLAGSEYRREWIVYVIFKFFTLELKKSNTALCDFLEEIQHSLNHFDSCINEISSKLPIETLNEAEKLITNILASSKFGDNGLGDVYQILKSDCAKDAFNSTLQSNNKEKLEERKLLVATQYFTDEYISTYLLSNSALLSDRDSVVVDPACGAGHILIAALKLRIEVFNSIELEHIYQSVEGYDIDPVMVELSKLSIYLFLTKNGLIPNINKIKVYGYEDAVLGKFTKKIEIDKPCVWITNPPYAGKRDLAPFIKDFLRTRYPSSKGDLCIGFMLELLENANAQDDIMLIMQKSWLTLSSYSELRKLIIENKLLKECIDLGSNSFSAISGEKANIALITLNKSFNSEKAQFCDLSKLSYTEKKLALEATPLKNKKEINTGKFLKINNFPLLYNIPETLINRLITSEKYGSFASPMQGTSTGDHKNFIDFIWNRKNDNNWKLVSKGGSFSRWFGLNSYCVKWGENGELVKQNSGSALRNLDKIDKTQLVYSDTGKLGLNVRLKVDGQIFVASGPGILVSEGCEYAHMAFLNSKFASYFISKTNDKLTISAGYIAALPCVKTIVNSKRLSELGKTATEVSKSISQWCITEYTYNFSKFINSKGNLIEPEKFIKIYLGEHSRLRQVEKEINIEIYKLFGLSELEIKEIEESFKPVKNSNTKPKEFNFSKLLDSDLKFSPKALEVKGFGTDNLSEYISHITNNYPLPNVEENLPLEDINFLSEIFIHHLILHLSGFISVSKFDINASIATLIRKVKDKIPATKLNSMLGISLEEWLITEFDVVHNQIFKDCPIVVTNNGNIIEVSELYND